MKFLSLAALSVLATIPTVVAQSCTLCEDGSSPENPDAPLKSEGSPLDTCIQLFAAVQVLQADSNDCISAKAVATYCGCPIPDGACRLCGGDAKVPAANIDVGLDYAASDYIVSAPPGEMLSCESMESYLHTLSADDETCAEITANVTDTCCTGAEDTTSTADENETTDEEEDETSAPAEPSAASTVGITGIVTLGAASAMMMVVTMM